MDWCQHLLRLSGLFASSEPSLVGFCRIGSSDPQLSLVNEVQLDTILLVTIDNFPPFVLLNSGLLLTNIKLDLDETIVLKATTHSWSYNVRFLGATDFVGAAAVRLNLIGAFDQRRVEASELVFDVIGTHPCKARSTIVAPHGWSSKRGIDAI